MCQFINLVKCPKDGDTMSKKELIMAKSIALFAEQSIASTSVQHITEACGISKGAFYLHFKSKDDLIVNIFEQFYKDIIGRYLEIIENDKSAQQKFTDSLIVFFEMFEDKLPFIITFTRQPTGTIKSQLLDLFKHYNNIINRALYDLILTMYGNKITPYATDIIVAIKGLVHGYMEHLLHHRKAYDFNQLASVIVERITIIVNHSTQWFLYSTSMQIEPQTPITLQTALNEITAQLAALDNEPLLYDSLVILQQELQKAQPQQAIIQGMLANIANEPTLQWLIFLVRHVLK